MTSSSESIAPISRLHLQNCVVYVFPASPTFFFSDTCRSTSSLPLSCQIQSTSIWFQLYDNHLTQPSRQERYAHSWTSLLVLEPLVAINPRVRKASEGERRQKRLAKYSQAKIGSKGHYTFVCHCDTQHHYITCPYLLFSFSFLHRRLSRSPMPIPRAWTRAITLDSFWGVGL